MEKTPFKSSPCAFSNITQVEILGCPTFLFMSTDEGQGGCISSDAMASGGPFSQGEELYGFVRRMPRILGIWWSITKKQASVQLVPPAHPPMPLLHAEERRLGLSSG